MLETSGPVPAFADAVRARDVQRLAGLLAHDSSLSIPPLHYLRRGADEVVESLVGLLSAFHHVRYDVRSRYVVPGTVTDEAVLSGRQIGSFLGTGPSRRTIALPVRVITEHDGASVTSVTLWPDLAVLRANLRGVGQVIDLRTVGEAEEVIAALRASLPAGQFKVIQGVEREELAPGLTSTAALPDAGPPATDRVVPKPPVPHKVRRRRAVLVGTAMLVATFAIIGWVAANALSWARSSDDHLRSIRLARQSSALDPSGNVAPDGRLPGADAAAGTEHDSQRRAAPDLAPGNGPQTAREAAAVAASQLTTNRTTVTIASDLLFDTDSYHLTPTARQILSRLIQRAGTQRRRGRVSVSGFTDDVGSARYNLELSRRRAAAVADALRVGLHGDGMTVVSNGYGLTRPVASNRTAQGRQLNRRVTVVFPPAG